MAESDAEGKGIGGFRIGIHELLRYGYAGFLAFALSGVLFPSWTDKEIERLGKVVAPIVAIVIGAAIYIIYRQSLARIVDRFIAWGWPPEKHTALTVAPFSVAAKSAPNSFRLIRDNPIGNGAIWDGFWCEHSELHVIYLTFFELLIAIVVALVTCKFCYVLVFSIACPLFLLMGVCGDVELNKREAGFLNTLITRERDVIHHLLLDAGYSQSVPPQKPNPPAAPTHGALGGAPPPAP